MSTSWKTMPLGSLIEINPSKRDRKWPYDYLDYIDISSVEEGFVNSPPSRLSIGDAPSRAQRLVQDGDTVLSTVRPNRRSMFFVKDPSPSTVVSTGFAVLRPRKGLVHPRFLYALVYNHEFTDYLVSREQGAAYPAVSSSDIADAVVSLPSYEEQERIAHILGTLDDKIELNRKMAVTLEEMARAIFKSWFIDFDPVRAKAEGRPTNLPPEIDALFPDSFEDSELGSIPAGWKVGCVDDDFALTMGQSPPGSTYNQKGEGLPFYQGRSDFGFRFPTHRVYCTAPTRLAKAGDTLISVRAPVGDINMANEVCAIGRGVAAARHRTGSRSYTYYYMRSIEAVFDKFESEGTVFGSIGKKDFHAIKCCICPREMVGLFERMVEPLDEKVRVIEGETSILATIRDSLLPKLLTGEITVKRAFSEA